MNKKHVILYALLLWVFFSCSDNSQKFSYKSKAYVKKGYVFPYSLNEPDRLWHLPKELVEISGLTFLKNNILACVQDEKGTVYFLNFQKRKIIGKCDFAKKGDYEGVERAGDNIWVLKSNGVLYKIKNCLNDHKAEVARFKTPLSGHNNVEGLGYDPVTGDLLLACKGYPYLQKKELEKARKYKRIYSFDPDGNADELTPFLTIQLDTIKKYKNYNTIASAGIELLAYFDPAKGDVAFQPSAVAVHPLTGNIYVLSSVGKSLAVFSRSGNLLALIPLKSKMHRQPEGICFSPDGTLYISNEGRGKKGKILKFDKITGK